MPAAKPKGTRRTGVILLPMPVRVRAFLEARIGGMSEATATSLATVVVVFAFLILKLFVVARGDVPTALAVLKTIGIADVLAGLVLSTLPLLVPGVLLLTSFSLTLLVIAHILRQPKMATKMDDVQAAELTSGAPTRTRWAGFYWRVGVPFVGAGVLGFFVTPWTAWILSCVFGAGAAGVYARGWTREHRATRVGLKTISGIAILVAGLPTIWQVMYSVWLPDEIAHVRGQSSSVIIGYNLDSSDDTTTILLGGYRVIYRLPAEDIVERVDCHPSYASLFHEKTPWELAASINGRVGGWFRAWVGGQTVTCPSRNGIVDEHLVDPGGYVDLGQIPNRGVH